jgi:hypothetical protein
MVPFKVDLYDPTGGVRQELPVVIEPGHAMRFVVRTRHAVGRDLIRLLPYGYQRESGITLRQLRRSIFRGYDKLEEYLPDDYLGLAPMFVTVTTARNKKVSTVLTTR